MDELPKQLGSLAADTGARYALVDHNRLGPAFGHDDASVVAVIDHHEDERVHLAAKPREIKVPTGSCSSLIAVHFLRGKTHAVVPRELADFLLSALVLDTNNVKPAPEGKARPDDLDAVKLLLPFSSLAQQPKRQKGVAAVSTTGQESLEDRTATLKAKKYDLSKLQGRDLLRRDYKEYESDKLHIRYGLATVPLQLREWLARPEIGGTWGPILEKMDEWAEERRLGIVGVLTSYKEGRELLFLLRGEGAELARLRQVFDELEKDETNGVLKLGALELGQPEYATKEESRKWDSIVFSYQQRNAAATRKQVAPAMKKAIEAAEAASS
jgi:exopolyphosphatase